MLSGFPLCERFIVKGRELRKHGIPTFCLCVWDDMAYIKTQSTTSITVYMMEMHQTGQENYLTEVMVETNGLEVSHLSRSPAAGRRGCFKCAVTLAAVMGLATAALVIGFVLHFFILTPSCKQVTKASLHGRSSVMCYPCFSSSLCLQDAPPPSDGAKVTKASPLTSEYHSCFSGFKSWFLHMLMENLSFNFQRVMNTEYTTSSL